MAILITLLIFFSIIIFPMESTDLIKPIIRGNIAAFGEFRFQVRLSSEGYTCGGALISNLWVLTAAHCVVKGHNKRNRVTVYLGFVNLEYTSSAISRDVTKEFMFVHEDFLLKDKDIAALNVQIRIQLNEHIQPVAMLKKNLRMYENISALTSGWGDTIINDENANSNLLRYKRISILSNRECSRKRNPDGKLPWIVCVTPISICSGDSGGPLVYKIEDAYFLIGIAKAVYDACDSSVPVNVQHQKQMQQQDQFSIRNIIQAMSQGKTTSAPSNNKNFLKSELKEIAQSQQETEKTNSNGSALVELLASNLQIQSNQFFHSQTAQSGNETCNIKKNLEEEECGDATCEESCCTSLKKTIAISEKQLTRGTCDNDRRIAGTSSSSQNTSNTLLASNTPASTKKSKIFPKRTAMDFVFGKYIGEGSYSTVYLGRDIHTKRTYAIKVCIKQHIVRENKQEYVRREREALSILSNVPGFVNLFCTFQDAQSLYFVMTYAPHGDLLPYINKVGSFDLKCARHYAAELVLACEHMHRHNIVHRDLKPENILLDENMHTLIADFGSAKILSSTVSQEKQLANKLTKTARMEKEKNQKYDEDCCSDIANEHDAGDYEDFSRQRQRRRASFVGTAQYVSPEILGNGSVTNAVDLWALGCIMYQMISGLPPFRGSNEYLIFKEILSCNIEFPQGFDLNAENLIRNLLKLDPAERIGAQDSCGRYDSIRSHPFFEGIDFDTIREKTPPPILPFLPGVSNFETFYDYNRVPENLEPGLDENQLRRLLGMELGTFVNDHGNVVENTSVHDLLVSSDSEKQELLEKQKSDKWHAFAENEIILKKGLVNKRKGLFARKRMLILTTGPRLIYIDPVQMVKKGEIPWSRDLRAEAKNFKIFFVHTPNRTYFLEDPEGYCLEWVDAIVKVHKMTYAD